MNNRLSAMEVELKLLQIQCSIESAKLYTLNDKEDLPEYVHYLYDLGEKLSNLIDELEIEYQKR